jgi:methylase of polypeptide subunit release factors
MFSLTPDAKSKLSTTIRSLRERLLTDLHNATEGTYRLSIKSLDKAGLAEEQRVKRQRLEQWLAEQVRAEAAGKNLKDEQSKQIWDRQLRTAEKLAAATLLNRLVVIKQMEAMGLIKPAVLTGGWQSPGYREFREFAPDLCKDDTEGYGTLLHLLYDELALELPGSFGKAGLTELFPVPASTLRATVEALDASELKDAWLDDTTLGWVYQYWNDPEREALDDKLNAGGKVEPHEIASKTQMFTERYMVEWLLHNSLGQTWLAICKKQGWTAEVEADGTLERLEERRKAWREKREVQLDALMPIEKGAEERWKYWVPQPLTEEVVEQASKSVRTIKILDPACGSGHFLVIAFGLLFALYQEESRHRGESWSDREIVESILENNLFGIDIDPRAVQIAAAALYLKAKSLCRNAELTVLNLVASNLQLASLSADDPALVELRHEIQEATSIPEPLTNQIVYALKGADQWGSLLKIDKEVEDAIRAYEQTTIPTVQADLFQEAVTVQPFNFERTKASVLEKLEQFLERCTSGDDLGLRLRGEQLAAGVRFIRMIREDSYDLVIGNPPYQGASKMEDAKYLLKHYPKGKANLYAAFLERGLQLAKPGGISALLTLRNWMFIQQFSTIREYLLGEFDLRLLGDFDRGAFDEVPNEVLAVVLSIFQKVPPNREISVAVQPTPLNDLSYDRQRTNRKRAAVLAQVGRYEFQCDRFDVIKEKPIVYWWDDAFLKHYTVLPKLGTTTPARAGTSTGNNIRFTRYVWEISECCTIFCSEIFDPLISQKWHPFINGGKGRKWFEPLLETINWKNKALENRTFDRATIRNPSFNWRPGVAIVMIGSEFSARAHRFKSICGNKGSSVFSVNTDDVTNLLALMNSSWSKKVMSALNPGIGFEIGDANRLPLSIMESASEIFAQLDHAFSEHEAARENSVEFKQPGISCWVYAQAWAQQAVDREAGKPLPAWKPVYKEPPAKNWVSYAVGVALGRFGANGEGILNEASADALPDGIFYLSGYSGDQRDSIDSLHHLACQPIHEAWTKWGSAISEGKPLRDWLRFNFFKDVHLGMYENRPIYFPLSSSKKNFVAFVSIHRWTENTLKTLLADYLMSDLRSLEGELSDLIEARSKGDRKQQSQAEDRYTKVQQLYDELKAFIDLVQQCAEQGPPPAKSSDTPREADARFAMDLDDGVMINSAALWPLLESQWPKPKTWWSELCNAQGKKDYDWSHLAARYFPNRVDAKCQQDASLAVAHGVFWKYHPAKAYEWELRLQDEIAPIFTIDEENSDTLRAEFEANYPKVVADLREKEEKRRERKRKKEDSEDYGPLFDTEQEDQED